MNFARWVYWLAGLYGLLILSPQFFVLEQIGKDYPPAVTHPEYFYGFLGCALAWQLAFLVVASDPVRYRPLMPATFVEKFSFTIATQALFWQGQLPAVVMVFGALDAVLGVLFIAAWVLTPTQPAGSVAAER